MIRIGEPFNMANIFDPALTLEHSFLDLFTIEVHGCSQLIKLFFAPNNIAEIAIYYALFQSLFWVIVFLSNIGVGSELGRCFFQKFSQSVQIGRRIQFVDILCLDTLDLLVDRHEEVIDGCLELTRNFGGGHLLHLRELSFVHFEFGIKQLFEFLSHEWGEI